MTPIVHKTEMQVREDHLDTIHEMAIQSFQHHVLQVRLDQGLFRSWRVGNPKSSFYHFNITTEPGRLFVTGDIGTLVLEREPDMLPWCREALGSIEYFASKVPQEIPTKQYSPELVRAWLHETLYGQDSGFRDLDQDTLEDLGELYRDEGWEFLQQDTTIARIYESGILDGCDFPDFNIYTPNFLWCREAVRKFLSLLDS